MLEKHTAWLMEPFRLSAMLEHARGLRVNDRIGLESRLESRRAAIGAENRGGLQRKSYAAVVQVHGPIEARLSFWSMLFGGTSIEEIQAQLNHYLADDECQSIILDIDSPGGSVHGVQELADFIFEARKFKPITAISNCFCASAAYWIGSACSELLAMPSADTGSIGVVMRHENIAGMLEKDGVEMTIIESGRYKSEGHPYGPLSAETKAYLQAESDAIYKRFVGAVARNRGVSEQTVLTKFGQGRMLSSEAALKAGMIDRITTFQHVIGNRKKSPASSAQVSKIARTRLEVAIERERSRRPS